MSGAGPAGEAQRRGGFPARPWLALALLGGALAAGIWTPWFIDFDEAVYAEASRGMLVSGDWVRPQWNGRPFYEKPALFYWLTASLFSVLGVTPLAPRLISLAATAGGLAFLIREVRRRLNDDAAEGATWVAGAALLPFSLGRLGLLDALLVAAITVAVLALARGLEEGGARRRRLLALGYVAAGVTLAVKGPAFPLLIGAILLLDALLRRRVIATVRASGALWGVPLVLAVGAPWYVLAYLADGRQVVDELIGVQTLARVTAPMQGHGGPVWYYLPILAVGLLPFSALVPGAVAALRRADEPARRLVCLALAWAAVPLLVFSLAATKLPQYVAPAIPAIALLVGAAASGATPVWRRRSWHAVLISGAAFAALVGTVPFVLPRLALSWGETGLRAAPALACVAATPWRWALLAPACALAAGCVAAWRLGLRGAAGRALRALGIAGAVGWAVLGIAAGEIGQRSAISPLVSLARQAAAALPAGAPIHLVELNHRVTPALATGRMLVFLSAKRPEDEERLRAVLSGGSPARVIVPVAWWPQLGRAAGGRELVRECGLVLVGESAVEATAVPPRAER